MKILASAVVLTSIMACSAPRKTAPVQSRAPAAEPAPPAQAPAPQLPPVAALPPPAVSTAAAAAPNPCFNSKYKFTCVIPEGFITTDEGEGPGMIMTLVQRSMRSDAQADLIITAHHIGTKISLDKYMDTHVIRDLKTAKGVLHLDSSTASYTTQTGFEVSVERQFASGDFKSKVFGFVIRPNVFIVNYSAPADFFDKKPDVGRQFVDSLKFTP